MYKIVIVDDERMVKRGLAAVIGAMGEPFAVAGEASDGLEALTMIRQHIPHLVITDISMPVMDGLELVAKIRAEFPQIRIVIISGYADFEYARQALHYNVTDYILKPIDPEELQRILRESSEEHLHVREKLALGSRMLLHHIGLLDEIADELWRMNGKQAEEMLTELCAATEEHSSEPSWAEQRYQDTLAILRRNLHDRGLPAMEDDSFAPEDLLLHPELLLPAMQQACQRLLERVAGARNPGQRRAIRKAIEWIHARYENPELSVQEVTEVAAITSTYFSRLFKEETGTTFIQYLTDLRMNRAKELLALPEVKVGEIAEQVGYSNYYHFAKTFKKQIGVTPTDYRKVRGVY